MHTAGACDMVLPGDLKYGDVLMVERTPDLLPVKEYGKGPYQIICLHGGPAGADLMADLAEPLSGNYGVLGYVQRRSGDIALSVARHIEDLQSIIEAHCPECPPVLLGSSWGAMLALAFGATYPNAVSGLAIVGCGCFDEESRSKIDGIRQARIRPEHCEEIERLNNEVADLGKRIGLIHQLIDYVDNYQKVPCEEVEFDFDPEAFNQTWNDMLRLQREGFYPARFANIGVPVLMVHGDYDPHPGNMIRKSIQTFVPHLQYSELEKCGHEPWREVHARDQFFQLLEEWLSGLL